MILGMALYPFASKLKQIQSLDAQRDHQRIVHLVACYEFPWDLTRSLELALFRTFCSPRISMLLDHTGEFRRLAQKRYDDTDILVSELLEWGYDSDRGTAALKRINQLHGRFEIDNEDYLYVLSTFVFVPIRWIDRYGWRQLTNNEKLAMFHFWRHVGMRMRIRDIPPGYEEFERFSRVYETQHFRYADTNRRVAAAVMTMFKGWFPRWLKPLADASIRAMMDPAMLEGFGLDPPPRPIRWWVATMLRTRAVTLRYLPKRRRPRLRTQLKHPSYPQGYAINQLGPPRNVDLDSSMAGRHEPRT